MRLAALPHVLGPVGLIKYRTSNLETSLLIVVIEFPTAEKAKEFYNSHEYRQAKELRKNAAIGEIIVVECVLNPGANR